MDSDQARITDRADGSRVIHFEDRRNGDKDFNDAVVPLAGPGGTTPTEPPTEAGFSFDSTKLVALLEALNKMTELVQSNDMPEHLLDKTIDVIENVTTALTAESEEGGNYSLDEITGLLSEVSSLQQEFEDTAADSDEEQEVLNALIDGTDVIVAALDSQNV